MSLNQDQKQAIHHLRQESQPTRRAVVQSMEDILYDAIPVLDHGFIRVIDYMGDDHAIVQAARVSYGKGTKQTSNDRALIRYLMRHHHTSPFEMCEIKCHIKLPIFVARQWLRHRTANVNEYSARYSILEDQFYIPGKSDLELTPSVGDAPTTSPLTVVTPENGVLAAQSQTNKQGREGTLSPAESQEAVANIQHMSTEAYALYEKLLNQTADGTLIDPDKQGLARELARMVLPTNIYTEFYWKIDLHNLLHFVRLRADEHTQHETRAYALVLKDVLQRWVPLTYAAFEDYVVKANHFSAQEMDVLRQNLSASQLERPANLSDREWGEFCKKMAI